MFDDTTYTSRHYASLYYDKNPNKKLKYGESTYVNNKLIMRDINANPILEHNVECGDTIIIDEMFRSFMANERIAEYKKFCKSVLLQETDNFSIY